MKRTAPLFACVLILGGLAAVADDYAELKFTVVKEDNGKPVRNASVVLHPVNKEGKQERGGMQLKTDPDGKAEFRGAPYGKLRVQVIARGFQTFGEDYDIDQPTEEIVIKLKRPQKQFSTYEDNKKDDKQP